MPEIRVLIVKEKPPVEITAEPIFSAVGLEHFVTASGKTVQEALDGFGRVCATAHYLSQKNKKPPFAGIRPAPEKFQQLYETGREQGFVILLGQNSPEGCTVSVVVAAAANAA